MRILVTGAAGFIGGSLSLEILRRWPDAEVLGVDNMNDSCSHDLRQERLSRLERLGGFRFVCGDISDRAALMRLFEEFRPEVVVNLAAQAGVRYSIDHPEPFVESNIVGFFNVLEACRHSRDMYEDGVRHLVFASSSSIYGSDNPVPYSTDARTDCPASLYAATKKSNELMAYSYSLLYGIPCTALRFFTVYGPAGRPDMAYFSFAAKMAEGERIQLFNYGECERDFTYIDDVVEAVMRVVEMEPKAKYSVYNVGNSRPVSLMDFVRVLYEELQGVGALPDGYSLEENIDFLPMQPGDVRVTCADVSALERDYDYRPTTPLRVGLRSFVDWYLCYKDKK